MLSMTLIMHRKGYLASDRKATVDKESYLHTSITKMFISEDKIFAGVCGGDILTKELWEKLYNVFSTLEFNGTKVNTKEDLVLDKDIKLDSTLIVLFNKKLYYINFSGSNKFSIYEPTDQTASYFRGNGTPAAIVLDNSDKNLSIPEIYKIVSYCENSVSKEFDCVHIDELRELPK